MPEACFSCPRCSQLLRSDQAAAASLSLRCPRCGICFRAAPSKVGIGAFLAWLLFGGMILLMAVGIGLAMLIHGKSMPADQAVAPRRVTDESRPVADPPAEVRPALSEDRPVASSRPQASDAPPPLPTPRPKPVKSDPPKPKAKAPPPKPAEGDKPAPAEAPQVHWLSASMQGQVDRAIDRGVEFLRRQQHFDGTWGHQTAEQGKRWTPGITALAGLTLLECGVSATDAQVQLIARYLRKQMPALTSTYSIATAILFFDRLGQKRDVPRLRTLALRLIAGQKPSGGWDYFCPALTGDEELGLLALLHKDRPTSSRDLFLTEGTRPMLGRLYRPRPSDSPPLGLFVGSASGVASAPRVRDSRGADPTPLARTDKPMSSEEESEPTRDERRLSEKALDAAARLCDRLKKTPALNASTSLDGVPDDRHPRTDNSNTQFAVLGLLAAEKYDVPMERALALLDWRFRNLVNAVGGWDYQTHRPTGAAMTCSGLLGLALKHGLLLPNPRERGRNIAVEDPLIHRALLALDRMMERTFLGFFQGRTNLDKIDLYCMWSVERVAVLYNLRTIGDLDWYPAGVRLLLPAQQSDGSWSAKGTRALDEPAIATSFALLFFKRSNLSPDLTRRLHRH